MLLIMSYMLWSTTNTLAQYQIKYNIIMSWTRFSLLLKPDFLFVYFPQEKMLKECFLWADIEPYIYILYWILGHTLSVFQVGMIILHSINKWSGMSTFCGIIVRHECSCNSCAI